MAKLSSFADGPCKLRLEFSVKLAFGVRSRISGLQTCLFGMLGLTNGRLSNGFV
jgi:hypothetical protein